MNPHSGAQTRPERALFLGAFVVIALIVGVNVATIANLRQNALQSAKSYLTGYSDVVSEHAESSFRAVDVVLSSLADRIARDGVNDTESFAALSSDAALHDQLKERLAGLPQVAGVMLVGAKGQIVASSFDVPTAGINLADRDYFRALRDDPSVEIFVSAPMRGLVTGELTFRLARRLSDPNGAFMGLMVGSLRKRFFESYYDAIISGEDTQVSLRRSDGLQLAAHPKGAAPTMSASQSRRGSAGPQMSSARRIANFPLVAAVSRSEDSVLRDWTKTAWLLSIVSTLSALLVAAVSLIMARRWRAQAAFLARLAESEALARQQSMQFETTLANLPQGLCMFDRDMRIAVANTQYSRLYDLAPEDIPVGTTMAEVIERRIARGVYAEGDPDEYRRSELTARDSGGALRRLTNGRMIAVNRFDMPDGGWISQHEDVTEAHGAMERISFLARQDSLTHLFNRTQLIEKMTEFLDLVRRGAATGFCVFLLDLDMFKGVNDTLGHGVGDRLLQEVGRRLRRATREFDVAARLGGDEFAILFILDETSKRKDAETTILKVA